MSQSSNPRARSNQIVAFAALGLAAIGALAIFILRQTTWTDEGEDEVSLNMRICHRRKPKERGKLGERKREISKVRLGKDTGNCIVQRTYHSRQDRTEHPNGITYTFTCFMLRETMIEDEAPEV